MTRKYFNSMLSSIGIIASIIFFLSLACPNDVQIRLLQLAVCIVVPIHTFAFFTFYLKLFSSHLWIRRIVIMLFSILTVIAGFWAFGYLQIDNRFFLTVLGSALLISTLVTAFVYYVADKIETRNLKAVNKKLAEEAKKNGE